MYYWISNQRLRVSQFNVFESKSIFKSNNCFKTLYCPKNISSFATLEVFLCLKCFSVGIQIQTGKIFVTLYWHFDVTTLRRWRWSWKRRKWKNESMQECWSDSPKDEIVENWMSQCTLCIVWTIRREDKVFNWYF